MSALRPARFFWRWATLWVAAPAIGLTSLVLPLAGTSSAADPSDLKYPAAASAVREALQREIYGSESARRALLDEAAAQAPEYAPARWQLGYVKDARRGWLKHDEFLKTSKAAWTLARYEREREATPDTIAGHLQLADWCAAEKLADQERAHLMRVIDLNPEHAAARQRLGFVRQGGNWISQQEIARDRSEETARRESLAKWRPLLAEIREGLESRSQQRRTFAAGKLQEIRDASAIPAIEDVFAGAKDEVALLAVAAIAAIEDHAAAQSLAKIAVLWPAEAVREAAAQALAQRTHDAFVPQLVGSMYSPVVSRFVAVNLPRGRIGYRHAFVREGENQQQVMLLDTEYQRIRVPGGDGRETESRMVEDVGATATRLEQAAAAQNRFTAALNERLAWVLKTATGVDLPADPDAWWTWWNDQNEVFVAGSKPVSIVQRSRSVAMVDRSSADVSGLGGGSGGGGSSQAHDCLAAGTPVWTAKGPLAIEQVRVGDLVLSQHAETGELAYKPVLRTTVRPSGKLVKIEAAREDFQTSGGHLFWVAGQGWTKARNLASGQILHTAEGPAYVKSVETGTEAATYNLVVADFNTYFVGDAKVMSHDNTVRTPTRAVVPGLAAD
ncbi:MAG: HINT domain-containing protein [Planctomycetaceae bacterium]|nr:HINT domain-containing protein [Planctomycetaceae bacterium]